MKRRISSAILPFLLLCTLFTQVTLAAETRVASVSPSLYFDGTTAKCSAICRGGTSADRLSITLTLYQGTTYVDSWSASGQGVISVSGEHDVVSGKSYTLTATFSVNGVIKTPVSNTLVCP